MAPAGGTPANTVLSEEGVIGRLNRTINGTVAVETRRTRKENRVGTSRHE